MQVKQQIVADINALSAKKCVGYLKRVYPAYYACLRSTVKYEIETPTDAEVLLFATIPLIEIKQKAQTALIATDSALANNLKILKNYDVRQTSKECSISTTTPTNTQDARQPYLEEWALHFSAKSMAGQKIEPMGEKFEHPKVKEEFTISVVTPIPMGFVCPTKLDAEKLSSEDFKCCAVNPSAVALACRITDLCTLKNSKWYPKIYTNAFFNMRKEYTECATELAHLLNNSVETLPKYIKGVELTGLLAQQCTQLLRTEVFQRVAAQIAKITDAVHLCEKKSKNVVRFKGRVGEFDSGSIDYALAIGSFCQGIRGGDKKDNSTMDYSYYCGYAMPRHAAKAFVLSNDLQRLFDHVHMPLKLVGKDVSKRQNLLMIANTFYGIIAVNRQPNDFLPIKDGSRVYRKEGVSFMYTTASDYVEVFFEDMQQAITNTERDYAVQYRSLDESILGNVIPCTAVHVMACFTSVGNTPIPFHDMTDNLEKWLNCSIEVNRSRTFFRHFNPFDRIASNYNMSFLLLDFSKIVRSIQTAADRYDACNDDYGYLDSILSAVMDADAYAEISAAAVQDKYDAQNEEEEEEEGDEANSQESVEEEDGDTITIAPEKEEVVRDRLEKSALPSKGLPQQNVKRRQRQERPVVPAKKESAVSSNFAQSVALY